MMLHRFGTYEEAALFVSMKRSEGYFAEILHEHAASLWGPLLVGGLAVWVSEEAAEEDDEVPSLELNGPNLPKELSAFVGLIMLVVPASLLLLFVSAILMHAAHYPAEVGEVLMRLLLYGALFVAVCVTIGWYASRWVHAIWNPLHPEHQMAKGLHVLMAGCLLLAYNSLGLVFATIFGLIGMGRGDEKKKPGQTDSPTRVE